jgi:rod shape-determining protein MreC
MLVGFNLFGGTSPVKMGVLAAFRPFLALLGEVDPPSLSPEENPAENPEIESLRARNARLSYEVHRLRDLLEKTSGADFEKKRYSFRGLPAQVLCRVGVPGLRCGVMIDRGSVDGVRKGMGVVSGDRVVGRVHRVGAEMCLVLLVTDPACKLRATFLSVRGEASESGEGAGEQVSGSSLPSHEGLCEGDLERDGGMRLSHLPRHASIEVQDDVVTTGFAGVFPPGMSIGRTTGVDDDVEGLFLDVSVKPAMGSEPLRSVSILLPAIPKEWEAAVESGR